MPIIPLDPSLSGAGRGIVSVGPVAFGPTEHGNPTFGWGAGGGASPAGFGGYMTWNHFKQLRTLIDERDGEATIDGATGALERIEFEGAKMGDLSGLYVLLDIRSDSSWTNTMDDGTCPFSLTAHYLGDQA